MLKIENAGPPGWIFREAIPGGLNGILMLWTGKTERGQALVFRVSPRGGKLHVSRRLVPANTVRVTTVQEVPPFWRGLPTAEIVAKAEALAAD